MTSDRFVVGNSVEIDGELFTIVQVTQPWRCTVKSSRDGREIEFVSTTWAEQAGVDIDGLDELLGLDVAKKVQDTPSR